MISPDDQNLQSYIKNDWYHILLLSPHLKLVWTSFLKHDTWYMYLACITDHDYLMTYTPSSLSTSICLSSHDHDNEADFDLINMSAWIVQP